MGDNLDISYLVEGFIHISYNSNGDSLKENIFHNACRHLADPCLQNAQDYHSISSSALSSFRLMWTPTRYTCRHYDSTKMMKVSKKFFRTKSWVKYGRRYDLPRVRHTVVVCDSGQIIPAWALTDACPCYEQLCGAFIASKITFIVQTTFPSEKWRMWSKEWDATEAVAHKHDAKPDGFNRVYDSVCCS